MKKIFIILTLLLITSTIKAQIVKMQVIGQKGVTTAQKNSLVVPLNEYWALYDTDNARWEYWNGSNWEVFGETTNIFEKELVNAENNINVGFNLTSKSIVFYNGKKIPTAQWSGIGTNILNLNLETKEYDKLTIKN